MESGNATVAKALVTSWSGLETEDVCVQNDAVSGECLWKCLATRQLSPHVGTTAYQFLSGSSSPPLRVTPKQNVAKEISQR